MTRRVTKCSHNRGDWIAEQAYWLCADCWEKLPERPRQYGPPMTGSGKDGPPQIITWEAVTAKADGITFSQFLKTMTRRYQLKTRPQLSLQDAYNAAIDFISALSDPYGDPSYCWDHGAAREFADEDMQDWDREGGTQ